MTIRLKTVLLATSILGLLGSGTTQAAPEQADQRLRKAVTTANIMKHLRAFDRIAKQNGGNRAAATRGYDQSLAYVSDLLRKAGYTVSTQAFDFPYFETVSEAFARLTPSARTYVADTDFTTMTYSGSGEVSGRVVPIDVELPPGPLPTSSTSGCEAADFPAPPGAGSIALIQRGACDFAVKATNAKAAGYAAVIIFNEGQEGRTDLLLGTLLEPFDLPVIGTTFTVGEELAELATMGPTTASISTETIAETRRTRNLLADSPGGRSFRTVVVGAHLDSVAEGPGVNDNGSGTAANLEIALQIAKLGYRPRNRLRFAFWGAEELGLVGSQYYVDRLTPAQLRTIDLNLNFDMVGSPNYVRFVYDGDGNLDGDGTTSVPGPNGSDEIERSLLKYFRDTGLATEPTAFDGRSDYGPFIAVGIPAGGLFSGAEGIKTPEQKQKFGGTAGVAYDACYHEACDDIGNLSMKSLDEFSNAMADVIWEYATRTKALPKPDAAEKARLLAMSRGFDRRGSHWVR